MLSFLKKIFGAKPAAESPAPYKVDEPSQFPFPKPSEDTKPAKKTIAKKPVARKAKAPKS